MHAMAQTRGNRRNSCNNAITQDIDSQGVTAPQYGHVSPPASRSPKNPPHASLKRASSPERTYKINVLKMSTSSLKLHMAILQMELLLVNRGKLSVKKIVIAQMNAQLTLMSQEMIRRDLHDFAVGKKQVDRGNIYSLGNRLKVA